MNDIVIMYVIWSSIEVLLIIAWFHEMNVYNVVDRPDRPRLRNTIAAVYLVMAWFPLFYVAVT